MQTRSSTRRALSTLAVVAALGGSLVGCLQRDLTPLIPCTVSGVSLQVNVENVDKVDLLMVVDNSLSMLEEQAKLQEQLPRLIEVLASGGKFDDTVPDFTPVKDLRVGVITTDIGTGNFGNTNCEAIGDDGLLLTRTGSTDEAGTMPPPGCGAMGYGNNEAFVNYVPNPDATDEELAAAASDFAAKVGCVAVVGPGGCGFEQQLEAPLKALTPPTSDITFAGGTEGHGVTNGFVREDSLLAILLVTDEEDCSAADYEIFNPTSTKYPIDAPAYHNVHCYLGDAPTEALHPVSRYIDGYLALREANPALLVFAAITGTPLEYDSGGTLDDVLEDPAMAFPYSTVLDPGSMQYVLTPSCTAGDDGDAAPPRRIVEVAKGLETAGAGVTVKSICASDFAPALSAVIVKIADALGGQCLPRALNPNSSGLVSCEVLEAQPPGTTCDSVGKGRSFLRNEGSGAMRREVCKIAQLTAKSTAEAATAPHTEDGWFYEFDLDEGPNGPGGENTDLEDACGQGARRISFAPGAEPATGARIRLECLQSVQEGDPNDNVVGGFCTTPNQACPPGGAVGGRPCEEPVELLCDPETLTWQVPCDDDSDCTPYVCDNGRENEAPAICVNPTCG